MYRRKPIDTAATQWHPGVEIPGLSEVVTQVHYSDDRTLYYVTRAGCRPNHWLTVAVEDGPATEEERDSKGFFVPGTVQFTTKDGRTYRRRVYWFNCFKVRSGPGVEPLAEDSDLFLDYASLENWPKDAVPEALVFPDNGKTPIRVRDGDWVVSEGGRVSVYPPEQFAALYEPTAAAA